MYLHGSQLQEAKALARAALGAGKRGRRPGPSNSGPTPSMCTIGISYIRICIWPVKLSRPIGPAAKSSWPIQGPRSKQFRIWHPREAIRSR